MKNTANWLFTPNIRLVSSDESKDVFESDELQLNILNSIQDGVSILDRDLNIRYINTYMQHWYSQPREIIGKKCYQIYHLRKIPCENCPSLRAIEERAPVRGLVRYSLSGYEKGWQELYAVPIFDQEDEILGVFEYVRDVTFQYRIENELSAMMERLESLEKNNEAMSHLLQQRKEQSQQLEETIIQNVEKFVKPSLDYLKRKTNPCDVAMVEGLIDEIVYPITKKRPSALEKLTSRELQISVMIKEGKISKEIADILVITTKTVDYHRANIRRKLGLNESKDQKTNLRSYLVSHL